MIKKKKIQEILDGWANVLRAEMNTLPLHIRELSESRLLICEYCPLRKKDTCSSKHEGTVVRTFVYGTKLRKQGEVVKGCGCNLNAKSKSVESLCPLGKW